MTSSWTSRVLDEHRAGNLTHAAVHVLLTLRTYRGHGGVAWPSHETLARRAGCCVRTVQRALAAAQDLGLVSWAERRVKSAWRWLRTSNLYRFHQPPGPVEPLPPTTRQMGRGVESEVIKKEAHEQKWGLGRPLLPIRTVEEQLAFLRLG